MDSPKVIQSHKQNQMYRIRMKKETQFIGRTIVPAVLGVLGFINYSILKFSCKFTLEAIFANKKIKSDLWRTCLFKKHQETWTKCLRIYNFFLYKQLMTNQYAGCLISVEELVLKLLKLVYALI